MVVTVFFGATLILTGLTPQEAQSQEKPPRQEMAAIPQEEGNKPEEKAKAANTEAVKTCDGGSIKLKAEEKRTLDLHNKIRKRLGLESLCVDPKLTRAARAHSKEMISKRYFGHSSHNGESSGTRLKRFGYNWWASGENLAWGSGSMSTPDNRFKAWMQSPGHRKNILDNNFREIGVGVFTADFKKTGKQHTMYTVDFGTRR
jgi:uncharacterized protein YkwD